MRVGTRRWLYHRSINVFSLPQTTLLSSRMPNTQPVAKPSHTMLLRASQERCESNVSRLFVIASTQTKASCAPSRRHRCIRDGC